MAPDFSGLEQSMISCSSSTASTDPTCTTIPILYHSLMTFLPPSIVRGQKQERMCQSMPKSAWKWQTPYLLMSLLTSKLGSSRKDKVTTCSEKRERKRISPPEHTVFMQYEMLAFASTQIENPSFPTLLPLSDTLLMALTISTYVGMHAWALSIHDAGTQHGFSMLGMCSVAEFPLSSQAIFQYLTQSLLSRSLLWLLCTHKNVLRLSWHWVHNYNNHTCLWISYKSRFLSDEG